MSREKAETLAAAFLNSAEFKEATGPRLTAFQLYATLLNRAPSHAELAFRSGLLREGMPLRDLVQAFTSSTDSLIHK